MVFLPHRYFFVVSVLDQFVRILLHRYYVYWSSQFAHNIFCSDVGITRMVKQTVQQ